MLRCLGPREQEEIDRTGQGLQRFPEDLHRHRKRLHTLILDGNGLREVPSAIGTLAKLQKLSISNNELENVSDAISRLTRLQELNLSHNAGLNEVPKEVNACKNLEVLDVSATGVQVLPDTMTQISSLRQLTINDSELQRLPADLSGLSNLVVLEARENMLKFLPVSISYVKHLRRLDLGSNEIEALPRTIGCLAELEELALDENGLTDLPVEINGFNALRELDISKNALVKLPSEFCELTSLTDLYLSENVLTELPEDIGLLTNLQLLKVDCNQLSALPDSLAKLTQLTELTLSDNAIDTLPSGIGRLKKLTSLHVDKNQLTAIPTELGDCESLNILTLRDNQLTELPRSIGQLAKLHVLDVACNQLQRLPFSIAELKLTALWLSERQSKPLPELVRDIDTDSGDHFARCDLLPQKPRETDSELANEEMNRRRAHDADDERRVAFAPDPNIPEAVPPIIGERPNVVQRQKTPYRSELEKMKTVARKKHMEEKRLSVASRSMSAEATFVRAPGASLGISVAGGRGVEQPFRDDDDGVFITKIKEGGLAEECKQFCLWDKIIRVNDKDFEGISHDEAVLFLKNSTGELHFHLLREVASKAEDGSAGGADKDASTAAGGGTASMASMVVHEDQAQPKLDVATEEQRPVESAAPVTVETTANETPAEAPKPAEQMSNEAEATLSDLDKHLENSIEDTKKEEIVTDTEEDVVLNRVNRSLGMSIVGGNDSSSLPFAPAGSSDVFISKVVSNGGADRCGRLRMGDRIIEVDGHNLINESHSYAVSALINSGQVVKMKVYHAKQPSGLVNVDIYRSVDERLGLSIKGGVDSKPGNPSDADDEGIFVSKIREDSAAAKCPELHVGQRLVEVNGHTLLGATHCDAVMILKEATTPVKMLVCDGYDPALARSLSPADSLRETLATINPPGSQPPTSQQSEDLPSPPPVEDTPGPEDPGTGDNLPPPPMADQDPAGGAGGDEDLPPPDPIVDEPAEELPPPPMED